MNLHNLHDEANAAPQTGQVSRHISVGGHLRLSVLWFASNFQTAALLPIVLPVQLLLFVAPGSVGNAQQATLLGWLSAAGSLIALFIPPVVGALSDRTTGPLGRRRPYIALGAAVEALGSVILARPGSLGGLFGGLLLFQVGSGIIGGAYQGLLPDMVPLDQRGEQSGYIGLMTILGNAGSLGLSALLLGSVTIYAVSADTISSGSAFFYLFTAVVLIIGVLLTVFGVHETPLESLPRRAAPPASLGKRLAEDWLGPWRHGNFTWVFLTRASVMLGLSLFMTFIEYYFANISGGSNFVQQTAALAVLALAGAAASALTLGIVSDKLRVRVSRVPLVCAASACMALAASGFLILPPGTPLWPLGLLFGLGFGGYSSVDWALAVDVLPATQNAGKDMGIWSTASTFPTLLAPLVGALVLHLSGQAGQTVFGYQLVFALAALCMIAGAVFIFAVRNVHGPEDVSSPEEALAATVAPTLAPAIATSEARPEPHEHPVRAWWRLVFRSGGGQARGFLRFWLFWEWLTSVVMPSHHEIPNAPYNVVEVQFTRYDAKPITLPDGTQVRRGDRVVILHINNRVYARIAATATPWRQLTMWRGDLRALARWAAVGGFPEGTRALYGYTLLGRSAPRLGFTIRRRPSTIRTRLDRFFLMGILVLYNPGGQRRLQRGTTYETEPVETWMSLSELQRLYGGDPGRKTSD